MAIPVLILGKSGSGKSASLRNFKQAGIINVLNKPLPFKNDFKMFVSDEYGAIKQMLLKAKAGSIVIDDAGYLITNQFMNGHSATGSGNKIFEFYNTIADEYWGLIEFVKKLPGDKIVYFIMHEDKNEMGDIKPKTIGKLLDDKVCVEGMFTIVLRATKQDGKHIFKTKSENFDVTKTPIGMFEVAEIDNDLKNVDDAIRDFYNIKQKGEN